MKKILLGIAVVAIVAVYSIYQRHDESVAAVIPNRRSVASGQAAAAAPTSNQSAASSATTSNSSVSNQASSDTTPNPAPVPSPAPSSGKYKNGTYHGDTTDAFYGNVQVQVVIQNGKLTTVNFLDYPHDNHTSQDINGQAMPMLQQEAIAAQSAKVDIISGATQTSLAFIQSLTSALSHAS